MPENEKGYSARDLTIWIDDGAGYVKIAAVNARDVARPKEGIDVSNDDSDGWRRLLAKPGTKMIDVSIEGVATVDNYARFLTKWNGTTLENVRIVHPDMSTEIGDFFLSNLQHQGGSAEHVAFTAELQSADAVAYAAAAAPVNSLAPSISGVAQVGATLTALPGSWTTAPVFTYQWQVDDGEGFDNIALATAQTYAPIVGQVGQPLRVVVTATNSEGNDTANSAPTADVLAE